jgi:hypothetical protein
MFQLLQCHYQSTQKCWSNNVDVKFSLFGDNISLTCIFQRYFKNDKFFFLHTSFIKVWYNFWGQFAIQHQNIQKSEKIIRIVTYSDSRNSCRGLLKKIKILPLHLQYINTMSSFIVSNEHLYWMNMEGHNCNTRYNTHLQFY